MSQTETQTVEKQKHHGEWIEYIDKEHCISGKIAIDTAKRDQIAWNMMEHNEIYGLAPFNYFYINDMVCFQYDVSSCRPVSELFQKKEGRFDMVFFLCREVFLIVEKASEYLLKKENFLLRPEWIFCDLFQKKVKLCYLPGKEKTEKREVLLLLEYLMEHINHKDRRMVEFIYGLYDISAEEHISVEEILDYIDKCPEQSMDVSSAEKESTFQSTEDSGYKPEPKEQKEKIWLLGREKESDICLPFMTVSRMHLQVVYNEEGYFLMDLSSKNGTFLNGKRLLPMQRVPCDEKDTICIGGLSFSLHITSSDIRLCNVSVKAAGLAWNLL